MIIVENLMNQKALGIIGFVLAVLVLIGFVVGIAYVAFVLIQSEKPVQAGTFRVESINLVKTTQTALAVTITNNGPDDIVLVTFNITQESYTFDLSSNPMPAHIQRGFSKFLTGYYEWAKQYSVTVYAKFASGEEFQTTVSVVCK
jgi:hypothetical protein